MAVDGQDVHVLFFGLGHALLRLEQHADHGRRSHGFRVARQDIAK
jgi:hypothetical protein